MISQNCNPFEYVVHYDGRIINYMEDKNLFPE